MARHRPGDYRPVGFKAIIGQTKFGCNGRGHVNGCAITGVAPDMGVIRNEIRRLRFAHGEMTQQELAERIGVTRQTVNAIELGKYSPSLEAAFRISAVFGKPLESVFRYSED